MLPNRRTEETRRLLRLRRELGIRPPRKQIPRQVFPTTIEREYAASLLRIVDQLRHSLQPLRDALPQLLESAARERADAGEGSRVRQLIADAATAMNRSLSTEALEDLAAKFARQTSTHARIQLDRQVHAALGANVFAGEPNLQKQVDGFVAENVSLITALPRQVLGEIEQAATRALVTGTLHKDLAKEIEGRLGVAEEKAKLIARDQVGKMYGQVNAARQQALGVERFIWRTMHDERVRSKHRLIDGKTYKYPKGHPIEGIPGQPINCRCFADPIFDDLLDESELTQIEPELESELFEPEGVSVAAPVLAPPVTPVASSPARLSTDELEFMHMEMQKDWQQVWQRQFDERMSVALAPENAHMYKLAKDDPRWIEWLKTLPPEPPGTLHTIPEARGKAMRYYMDNEGYQRINGTLRHGTDWLKARKGVEDFDLSLKTVGDITRVLDDITRETKMPRAATVYRGVRVKDGVSVIPDDAFTVGKSWSDPAFGSTTTNLEKAKEFTAKGDQGAMFTIEVPAGKGVMPIGDSLGESELLLGRDTEYTVVEVKTDPDGFRHVRMRVLR